MNEDEQNCHGYKGTRDVPECFINAFLQRYVLRHMANGPKYISEMKQ